MGWLGFPTCNELVRDFYQTSDLNGSSVAIYRNLGGSGLEFVRPLETVWLVQRYHLLQESPPPPPILFACTMHRSMAMSSSVHLLAAGNGVLSFSEFVIFLSHIQAGLLMQT